MLWRVRHTTHVLPLVLLSPSPGLSRFGAQMSRVILPSRTPLRLLIYLFPSAARRSVGTLPRGCSMAHRRPSRQPRRGSRGEPKRRESASCISDRMVWKIAETGQRSGASAHRRPRQQRCWPVGEGERNEEGRGRPPAAQQPSVPSTGSESSVA